MKKKYLFLLFFTLLIQHSIGQTINDQGAVSTAMAGLNVTETNIWSINNNIGSLSSLDKTLAGISINNKFLTQDLTTGTLAFAIPFNKSAFGVNYSNFGNNYYQYQSAGLGYSMQLGENISAGVKMNYHYINLGNLYGSKSIVSGDLGCTAKLSSDLNLGVSIKNPTLSKLAEYEDERLPTIIQLGFNYSVSDQLHTLIAIEKDILYPASVKAAIIYQPMKSFVLRGGVGSNPTTAGFGIGTSIKQLNIDIASQYHQILGFSPELSIYYSFK